MRTACFADAYALESVQTCCAPSCPLDSSHFTPTGMESNACSPNSVNPLDIDPLESAQSSPPSPFCFPGNLIGFPDSESPSVSVDIAVAPNTDSGTSPSEPPLPLLLQPHRDPQQTSPNACRRLCAVYNSPRKAETAISSAASIVSRIQTLGDEAILAYNSRRKPAHEVRLAIVHKCTSILMP